ncbi:hypothetical protein [Dyadobacter sp. CY343]|uniref:hypothetical protein n=1 Tax=Dyadobacter sp. CY343 TaxID=2907299 RepID=UPI001F3EC95C|nr:hypothetical protein [Dyadobacter sp. CY343]MCE7061228.1 hypothetical protein [Dyadobacter sp. CY343]
MKNNLLVVVMISAVFVFTSCNDSSKGDSDYGKVIAVDSVANKSKNEVDNLLGASDDQKPWTDKESGCKSCPVAFYKNGVVEVIYIKGKADRITVNKVKYPFEQSIILGAIGLKETDPSFKNSNVMRWSNIPGFKEISAFNANDQIDYILIKTNTN